MLSGLASASMRKSTKACGRQQRKRARQRVVLLQQRDPETIALWEALVGQSATHWNEVYEKLGSEVATKKEQREVTSAFAGGAAILLLLGGGLSLRWFRRLL